jgi:uncharacterized zinc-type alcohol dehydrogenase-like protein
MLETRPVSSPSHLTVPARGYAAPGPSRPLEPFNFARREPGPRDIVIDIKYCGICHSDIHQVRDEWAEGIFPMVPGHEIAGFVSRVGAEVNRFKIGDRAGVGCFVDSCRECEACRAGLEQYCENHLVQTYNGLEADGATPTYGGYSNHIVIDEKYALHLPTNLDLSRVAPLLCAGVTTWSPLKHWNVGPGQRVGIVGLGGLGHMAVQFASQFGADVTLFTTSPGKTHDARRLGAQHVVNSREEGALTNLARSFDFILSTVSSEYALNTYLELLKRDGTLVVVGIPSTPPRLDLQPLISMRRTVAGSMIGGIRETQQMLDYCGAHGVASDVEVIPIQQVNEAYERVLRGDVRYRFVIDMQTL